MKAMVVKEANGPFVLEERDVPEPGPGQAAITADRRATATERASARELELQRASGGAAHAKVPVEPPALGVALILVEAYGVAVDPVDQDVATGIGAIDREAVFAVSRASKTRSSESFTG